MYKNDVLQGDDDADTDYSDDDDDDEDDNDGKKVIIICRGIYFFVFVLCSVILVSLSVC